MTPRPHDRWSARVKGGLFVVTVEAAIVAAIAAFGILVAFVVDWWV